MSGTVILRKRSLVSLAATTLLVLSLFVGITAVPIATLAFSSPGNAETPVPEEFEPFFPSKPSTTGAHEEDPYANIHANLRTWMSTGTIPKELRHIGDRIEVIITASRSIDIKELANYMWVRNVFSLGFGYVIQGLVSTPKDLVYISAMDGVGRIMGNPYFEFRSEPDAPVTDQFRAREIMGLEQVASQYPDYNGSHRYR